VAINIAVAGKGGTGKTTFAALLIRHLIQKHKGSILAVDADPNSNLNEALGVEVKTVIADILEDTKNPKAIPNGMTKDMFVQYKLSQALTETEHFDLVVMGGPQGAGCYCYPNDLLRKNMEDLSGNYKYLVMDNEAGLEHISRKTIPRVDHLFVISDAAARGIRSAGRVHELVKSLKTPVQNLYLVVTKVTERGLEELQPEIDKTGLQLLGTIPYDTTVTEFDIKGKALFDLPDESPVVQAVDNLLARVDL